LKKLWSAFSSAGAVEGNFHEVQTDGEPAEDFQLRMADRHQRRLHRMMRSIDSLVVHNRWLVKQYQSRIESSTVLHPVIQERADAVYARYPLRVEGKDDLLQAAARSNVELSDFYETPVDPLPREQWHLVNYKAGSCPEAESRAKEVVSLPMHQRVTAAYVEQAAALLS
jgi:dTDP-4-amino-4,6-dideoxygalactose transaminase